jgi:hypothetical protein
MVIKSEIKHSSIKDLQAARESVPGDWVTLPADDAKKFRTGFVAFHPTLEGTEGYPEEYHFTPLYDTDEECKRVEHETYEDLVQSFNVFQNTEGTKIHNCNDPRTLTVGFSVHPQREWHCIGLNNLRESGVKDVKDLPWNSMGA